jgi:hypothetical protein
VADECSFLGDCGFSPWRVAMGERQYAAQPEYKNSDHSSSVTP